MRPSSGRVSVPARSLFSNGLVTSHPCGIAISGTVAAAVYRSLEQQKPERIVVLAFPHTAASGEWRSRTSNHRDAAGRRPIDREFARGSRASPKTRSATIFRDSVASCKGRPQTGE